MIARIKNFVKEHESDIILFIAVVLLTLLAFALGYIVARVGETLNLEISSISDS